jgi:ATP-dependent helicase/nuclease subunit A
MNIPEQTLKEQYASSNPENSAWVSANAGSGKTHVLTQRVIRLMLAGNAPDKILCLTFTKAAAANMKNRVFKTLADWTMMENEKLDREIRNTTDTTVTPAIRRRARQLFALALDTPGGLKIQTIHAFCTALLHQFPLEANVPGHFEEIQELEQAAMLNEARSRTLSTGNGDSAMHYAALVPHASDDAIEKALNAIINMRQEFLSWTKGDVELALEPLYEQIGMDKAATPESIRQAAVLDILTDGEKLSEICTRASSGEKATDLNLARALQMLIETKDMEETFETVRQAFLTTQNTPRKRIATVHVTDEIPYAADFLADLALKMITTLEKTNALQVLQNSFHLFKIGEAVLALYETMKQQRGLVDFDDQIDKCAILLARSEIRDWIRYRLDNGIDHMLVDEAQDTSPKQWEIINAITDDFHSGESAGNSNRTVFVVGDEKQSIFSFQGAEPEEFDKQRRQLEKRVIAADKKFHSGSLDLSFRSTQDVLHAVDEVFKLPEAFKGLTQSGDTPVHDAVRSAHPGEVQVWPLHVAEKSSDPDSWLDAVDKKPADDPAVLLARQITQSIGDWVGKKLPGMDRPLKFGDIMVLVRKRDRFLTAFTRTMKDAGLAIAGADRFVMTDHIAVEDLLALGRIVLLPEDDLSLACVLKSVFFNVDEEMLFAFSHGREKLSLYDQIIKLSKDGSAHAAKILKELDTIFNIGRALSVYDFYAFLLGKMEGRKKILARLGMEAEDVLDAFLDEALEFTNNRNGGLETFITELTNAEPTIKRELEMERDEVRVITVHSSKGLEASVVFLVDHCGNAWTEKHRPEILEIRNEPHQKGYLWLDSSSRHFEETRESTELVRQAAEAEYRRLLYVGMTRAADRLIVCGYRAATEPKHTYWHAMVTQALTDSASTIKNEAGETIALRWVSKEQSAISEKQTEEQESAALSCLDNPPAWLFEPAKADPPLPRPLTPSGAYALIDPDSLTEDSMKFSETPEKNTIAIQRGNATHKLLEILPDVPVDSRPALARDYLEKTCPTLSFKQQGKIIDEVFGIFTNEAFKPLFEGEAQTEVSLAGRLDIKSAGMLVTGQIDRLVVGDETVTILDYKTNRIVPNSPQEAPEEYITQLALYRELVARIYKSKRIISALLWTQTPELMVIPDEMLDSALETIKNR